MIHENPSLSFFEAINASTKKIFQFTGRSRRSEFWWTQFLMLILSLVLSPLVYILVIPLTFRRLHDTGRSGWWWGFGALLKIAFFISFGYDFVMTILNMDELVEYKYQFFVEMYIKYGLFLIGIGLYQIILFGLCCLDSEQYENEYGESPKYIDDDSIDEKS